MPDYENQEPFIDAEFEDIVTNKAIIKIPDPRLFENVEPRCPCILLLDTSYSMNGQPIAELSAAIKQFKEDLMEDTLARKRVEVAVVTFGGSVQVVSEFQTAEDFQPPTLSVRGDTPMGEAIEKTIEILTIRKAQIRSQGVQLYRPWIVLITDGAPTDSWQTAAQLVRKGEASKRFILFPIGVSGYNKQILAEISVLEPVRLIDYSKFRQLFKWLSSSLASVSNSQPGDAIHPVNPTMPGGWGVID
ncbi:MAG: VWA domain-containing protein [Pyrinomonadaceae bacterium]